MRDAAAALEFERASVLRDKLEAVRAADAVRQMELDRPEDLDVLGLAEDELEAAVQVFHVRSGKVVGRLAMFVDKVEDLTPASWWSGSWSTSTPTRRPACPARCWCRPCRPTPRRWRQYLDDRRRWPGGRPGPDAGPEAGPAGDGGAQRPRRLRAPPAPPHLGPQQPGPSPRVAPARTRPPRRSPPHRVLRHEPPPGHRLRRLDGGVRGRAARRRATTATSRWPPWPATTTTRRWRRS